MLEMLHIENIAIIERGGAAWTKVLELRYNVSLKKSTY